MSVFSCLNISATGMTAQRLRTDIISQNIANVNTTRTANGGAYVRKTVVFGEKTSGGFQTALSNAMKGNNAGAGVKVIAIREDKESAMKRVYEPANPDADEEGYVTYPNVDTVTEMTNMIDASRAYEANVTAFNATKSMALKGLEVGSK